MLGISKTALYELLEVAFRNKRYMLNGKLCHISKETFDIWYKQYDL